jgi:hypothetical protein
MTSKMQYLHRIRLVAYIDQLGYLRCLKCWDGEDVYVRVHADDRPHGEEECDSCGLVVKEVE